MASPGAPAVHHLVIRAGGALGMSQTDLGKLLLSSRKTVGRWQSGRSRPADITLHALARAVHPKDAGLAREIAAAGFATLSELGLPEPPSAAPARPAPSPRLLGNILVCAAAETLDASPRAMRPALLSALQTAKELGLTVEEAVSALQGEGSPEDRKTRKR